MSEFLIGLLGALIGSAGTCLTVYLQTRSELRIKMFDKVADLALMDRQTTIEVAQKNPGSGKVMIPPVSVYLYYHYQVFKSMIASNLDVKKFKELSEEQDRLLSFLKEQQND